ncbi:MAG: hypothetical protein EOP83_28355 [Verrucomicrobiaceae bacterium]|nr:MAG: hypothetical protein EOP83_28355 [Verrucomicrobiaceae bacterium]
MIAILSAALLAVTPAQATSHAGFCAAIIDGKAIVTDAKETPSKAALEADFRTFLNGKNATLSGCMVGSSVEIANGMMRAKVIQIGREGYEITLYGW